MSKETKRFFRAAVLESIGSPLAIKKLIFPQLKYGQVLVEISYSSICASQLFEISGDRGIDRYLPHLLGHEGVGTVVEIGPGVTNFRVGDIVVLTWIQQDGIECESITHESINGEVINAGKVTTFAEFTVVSENRLFKAPLNIDEKLLPLLGCAALTGAGMVMEHHSGEKRVLVVGGGGVGIFTVLALMHQGVGAIHVVEPSKEKRKMISSLSEIVVTYDSLEEDRLRKEVEDEGEFREVFVCTSSSSALQESLSLLAAPGLLVFCTHPKKGELLRLDPFDLIRGKVILGSWGGGCKNGLIRQQVIDFYIKAVDRLEGLISKPLGIDEINEAVKLAKRNSHMRVMIRMQK